MNQSINIKQQNDQDGNYGANLRASPIALPDYTSFKHVSASLQCAGFSSLVIDVYRQGSVPGAGIAEW